MLSQIECDQFPSQAFRAAVFCLHFRFSWDAPYPKALLDAAGVCQPNTQNLLCAEFPELPTARGSCGKGNGRTEELRNLGNYVLVLLWLWSETSEGKVFVILALG